MPRAQSSRLAVAHHVNTRSGRDDGNEDAVALQLRRNAKDGKDDVGKVRGRGTVLPASAAAPREAP